jgi:hypothetical protein
MRDWTVAVAQYSESACSSTVYLKIWLYNNLDMFNHDNQLKHSEYFLVSSQIN